MQIDGINIPDAWCELLKSLQLTDPTAVIAGGAIRDLYLGHQPKDLDFFIQGPLPVWDAPIDSDMDYAGMKYVVAVAGYNFDPPINVVIVENATTIELIESFDFGICQIAFDGQKIIKSAAFDWDFKYGLMTMRHTDRYQRSLERYQRIGKRLDLTIAIPALEIKVA